MKRILSLLIFISLFGPTAGTAQQAEIDTIRTPGSQTDSTRRSSKTSIDTLVNYSAKDSIVYSLSTRYMYLYGNSDLQYQSVGLKAERVNINWDNATLLAHGIADTVKPDSVIGKPVMRDGGDEYHGDQVRYNFQTKKGKITLGKTQMDNGYYVGTEIKKIESDVLCVANGTYTTCDCKEPHFYFESPEMKVFVRDKVVAEPVYFFIAGVPVFALPFGVFPAHGGRSSGIIGPAYGEDARYGWYLSHIGYYWAASDYWDIATAFDIYSRGRWQNQTSINYRLRYNFGGSITARITSTPEGETDDPDYSKRREYYVNLIHNQQISPSSKLDVNFTFMSSDYFRNFSYNLSDILTQNVRSDATYWKSWESANQSLSINVHRDQNLSTDETSETLPSVRFSWSQIQPFRNKTKSRGTVSSAGSDMSFIETLSLSYSADAGNHRTKLIKNVDSVKTEADADSLQAVNNFEKTDKQNLNQILSLSISPKLGHFSVTPTISLNDQRSWGQIETPERNDQDSLLIYTTEHSKIVKGNLSTGISTSTRFYGLFQPNVFGITALRHTVEPRFSITYNKQIYGDEMQKHSMMGSLSIGNNFEMKTQKGDSAQTEEKIQLMNIGINTSYDFAADSMNFSAVSLNYRTNIAQIFDISGNATYNLYAYDETAKARVNRFLISESGRFGDLTNFSLSLSTSFKGEKKQKSADAGIPDNVKQEQEALSGQAGGSPGQKKIFQSQYDIEDADFSIPWNIRIDLNFSQSRPRPDPQSYSRNASIKASLSFNLTEKWQIATSGSYNFVDKKHLINSVTVTRDLHCWVMSFSWFPMGIREGYRFEIKVKAPQLQDIKLTKQSDNRGVYR
ncbi:MAG: LPS-assembly protein LptD [Bacteroidetes bacterium]|nr:LPS-assembly protein LptD [Bacteroidota bacterium]